MNEFGIYELTDDSRSVWQPTGIILIDIIVTFQEWDSFWVFAVNKKI